VKNIVLEEIDTLIERQPLLKVSSANEDVIISGNYKISNQIDDDVFEDYFAIEILVPRDFPDVIPIVKTTDNRICANNYNGHIYNNGEFCMETDTAMAGHLCENPSLLGFLTKFLDSYLCGFLFKQKYGKLPFGEHEHGYTGLLDHYKDLFKTDKLSIAYYLLACVTLLNLEERRLCPCQSGLLYQDCHREKINKMKASKIIYRYINDFYVITDSLIKQNK
jgi:hypothetical protein